MTKQNQCCGFPTAKVYELRGRACIADACAIPGARSLEDCTKTTKTQQFQKTYDGRQWSLFEVQVLAFFMSRIFPTDALREVCTYAHIIERISSLEDLADPSKISKLQRDIERVREILRL